MATTPTDLKQSRVGKRPVELPRGVSATLKDGKIEIKGPKGTLNRVHPPSIDVKVEGTAVKIMPTDATSVSILFLTQLAETYPAIPLNELLATVRATHQINDAAAA